MRESTAPELEGVESDVGAADTISHDASGHDMAGAEISETAADEVKPLSTEDIPTDIPGYVEPKEAPTRRDDVDIPLTRHTLLACASAPMERLAREQLAKHDITPPEGKIALAWLLQQAHRERGRPELKAFDRNIHHAVMSDGYREMFVGDMNGYSTRGGKFDNEKLRSLITSLRNGHVATTEVPASFVTRLCDVGAAILKGEEIGIASAEKNLTGVEENTPSSEYNDNPKTPPKEASAISDGLSAIAGGAVPATALHRSAPVIDADAAPWGDAVPSSRVEAFSAHQHERPVYSTALPEGVVTIQSSTDHGNIVRRALLEEEHQGKKVKQEIAVKLVPLRSSAAGGKNAEEPFQFDSLSIPPSDTEYGVFIQVDGRKPTTPDLKARFATSERAEKFAHDLVHICVNEHYGTEPGQSVNIDKLIKRAQKASQSQQPALA